MKHGSLSVQFASPVVASIRGAEFRPTGEESGAGGGHGPAPFVTISRQPGVEGRALAVDLAARLNQIDPDELPWTVWEDEVVRRVAKEHRLSPDQVAALEDQRPSWLANLVASVTLASKSAPEELAVFHRVEATVRALAERGRVIVVGWGGACITRDMPNGLHVRLVAPLEYRVAAAVELLGLSKEAAADWVRETEVSRRAFYRRHWPNRRAVPEGYSMILNVAVIPIEQQVAAILAVLPTLPAPARASGVAAG